MPSPARTKSIIQTFLAAKLGLLTTVGHVFYVDSGHAAARDQSGAGLNPATPFATIDYAIGQCTANNGDVIVVAPGHTESVVAAAGIDADVAGITIVGQGLGTDMPTVTIGTLTTATVRINADNVTISGIRFTAGTAQLLVKMIDINANYARLTDCVFVAASTATFLVKSFLNLATTMDYLTVQRCRFEQGTDPAGTDGGVDSGALYCIDSEYIFFEECWFSGNFETAIFHNRTTACKHLWVKNCWGIQALSGAEPFQLVAGATGGTLGGGFITPAETAATEATLVGTIGDGFFCLAGTTFGNDGGAGGQGGIIPATAS